MLATVSIAASVPSLFEDASATTFVVSRDDTSGSLAVSYGISGAAVNSADYTTLSGSVTIADGEPSATITLSPIDDGDPEDDKDVVLTLSGGSSSSSGSYTINSNASEATITILDNDGGGGGSSSSSPVISVSASESPSETGPTSGTFTITRSGPTANPLTVNYGMSGEAVNVADYVSLSGSVTIPANAASAVVTLTPFDDQDDEGSEDAILSLNSSSGYAVSSNASAATLTIVDNDDQSLAVAVTLSASQTQTAEGDETSLIFARSNSAGELTVYFTLDAASSATENDLEDSLPGSVTFLDGQPTATIPLTIADDGEAEPIENLVFNLSWYTYGPVPYGMGDPSSASISIAASGSQLPPVISDQSFTLAENSPNGTIAGTVVASDPDSPPESLTFSIISGNDSGTFAIESATGVLSVADPALLDFEETPLWTLGISVSDGALTAMALAFVAVADKNEAPEITNAPETTFEVPFGYSRELGLYQFTAVDPDNKVVPTKQTLTFSLTDDGGGLFSITPGGILQMTPSAWSQPPGFFEVERNIVVKVTDSGTPAKSDSETVPIKFVTGATIFADAQAIENGADSIGLTFRRYAMDYSMPLTLNFEIQFGGVAGGVPPSAFSHLPYGDAWTDDIQYSSLSAAVHPEPLPGTGGPQVYRGEVLIPAGAPYSAPVTLLPAIDGVIEGVEVFSVELISGPGYTVVWESAPEGAADGTRPALFQGAATHTLAILDGVTLFAPHNTAAALRDYVMEDSELGTNPGIHVNDVRQGGEANCWLMSVLASITAQRPGQIEKLFRPLEGGGYSVALFERDAAGVFAWRWKDYSMADLLSVGIYGASLSGDRDVEGRFEIWSNLLTRRFMTSTYAENFTHGGYEAAYRGFTGAMAGSVLIDGLTNDKIIEKIREKMDGNLVVVGTKSSFNGNTFRNVNTTPHRIYANHGYYVTHASETEGLTLTNPWGHTNVSPLPVGDLSAVLDEQFTWISLSSFTTPPAP